MMTVSRRSIRLDVNLLSVPRLAVDRHVTHIEYSTGPSLHI